MTQVLSVIGATASGKTNLALQFAEKFNGEIISCDSVQIYKEFDIVSAKPSLTELSLIPHHLISVLEPTQPCNAGYWKEQAIHSVNDIVSRGKTPIIVGGTGLYLKALYLGMFEQNSRNQEYREFLQQESKIKGLDSLYAQLVSLDVEYANKISKNDELRIIRALEVIKVTGIKFSELHHHNVKPDWKWVFTKPTLSREIIYQQIENRIHKMMGQGAIEEVEILLLKYGDIPPLKTIGYRHIVDYITGKIDKQTMLDTMILDTRHFAKRQETLFRSLIPESLLKNSEILLEKGLNNE